MVKERNPKKCVLTAVILVALLCATAAADVIYVDADASPGGNGQTWGTAYNYLQDALYKPPTGGDEIWVADGTYKPAGPGGGRTAIFQLKNGVGIYGGFAGTETSLDERDWQTNETILSGDLNGDDVGFTNNAENSYHVVTGSGTDATAILDGFTITAGNANSSTWPHDGGGGMSNYPDSSPTVTNCTFTGNSAYADGGGMRNWSNSKPIITQCTFSGNSSSQEGGGMMNGEASRPTVTNCTFSGNSAGEDGGGMYNNQTSNPMVTNCTFSGNSADFTGGGMYNVNSSSPTVTNCTFSGNSAGTHGGGMCNTDSNPTLTNCILWGDSAPTGPEIHNSGSTPIVTYSDIAGGYTGTGNINADPLFITGPHGDFYLSQIASGQLSNSPCVDTGGGVASDWFSSGTTRTDEVDDVGTVDMGFHYNAED